MSCSSISPTTAWPHSVSVRAFLANGFCSQIKSCQLVIAWGAVTISNSLNVCDNSIRPLLCFIVNRFCICSQINTKDSNGDSKNNKV
jgi:hypothetical protein